MLWMLNTSITFSFSKICSTVFSDKINDPKVKRQTAVWTQKQRVLRQEYHEILLEQKSQIKYQSSDIFKRKQNDENEFAKAIERLEELKKEEENIRKRKENLERNRRITQESNEIKQKHILNEKDKEIDS